MAGEDEKKTGEGASPTTTLQTSFFIMPGNALKSLRDELSISSNEKVMEGILYRYGIRCGEGMIQRMGMECEDLVGVAEVLPGLWAGVGLGRIQIKDVTDGGMRIIFKEAIESQTAGQSHEAVCHFTRGYLAGVTSALVDYKVDCIEEECMAKGDEFCIHHLTVAKEDLTPVPEAEAETGAKSPTFKHNMDTGMSYLIKEEIPDQSYDIFVDRVLNGCQGLCITRDYPEKVRNKYNLKKTPILWLTNAESELAIEPVQLGKLYHKIEDFLKKSENSVVLLSGIEYIITQNNYASALKFLQLIRDQISIYNSLLIAPISPSTLNEKDLKMIEREMTVWQPPQDEGVRR
jgi:predicted hydrocarbon binding protein